MSKSLFVLLLGARFLAAETVLAPGTGMQIRLKSPVSTDQSKSGQPVEAVVITPVTVEGHVVIPAGTAVRGTVGQVKTSTKPDEAAILLLRFTDISTPQGKTLKLKARVDDVDNAREEVDEAGRVIGILASETLAARIDQGIDKVAQRTPGLADVLAAARNAVIADKPSGEIRYEPGVELRLRLTDTLRWPGDPQPASLATVDNEPALAQLVNSLPFRTTAEKPARPSDITNLMFIGSEQRVRETFAAAGWSLARQLTAESAIETVRAIAELRGYKEAPMSHLLLDGRHSDFDYQKGNNTFEKRHHLRIWRRSETWEGKTVWVCAATHDTGIEFSDENRTFIHTIDSQVDNERTKVMNDLLFTGKVKAASLVERPAVPRRTTNATGDIIETEGRMAVIVLE